MKENPDKQPDFESQTELRRRAENKHASEHHDKPDLSIVDKNTLLHELEVHQIELEMQNEDLRRTQQELQKSLNQYADLFDFAPVGYFVLDHHFVIIEANLTSKRLLRVESNNLSGYRFTQFIAPDFQDTFFQSMMSIDDGIEQTLEIQMQRTRESVFYAELRIVALKTPDNQLLFRIAVTDITERKQAEEIIARAKDELEINVNERTRQLEKANLELKQYSNRITQIQEMERKRIAYELHDDTAQYLSILKMQLEVLAHSEQIQSSKVKNQLESLEKDAERAFHDIRRYSHELRPVMLEYQGLAAALQQIADDFYKLGQFQVKVRIEGVEPELSEEIKLGFFRIAQEALNNIRKHAKASQININVQFHSGKIKMAVSDNGEGFDSVRALDESAGNGSLGLMSMTERAKMIGANLNFISKPGLGTDVNVELLL